MEDKLNELISKCDSVYLNKNIHVLADVKQSDRVRKAFSEKHNKEILEVAPII